MIEPDRTESFEEEIVGPVAYVAARNAACHYKPDINSPVRIIPPLGSEVRVLAHEGEWVLIEIWLKEAWCEKGKLSNSRDFTTRPSFDISPYLFLGPSISSNSSSFGSSYVEYGPRGGRFTRTKTGHRRYF